MFYNVAKFIVNVAFRIVFRIKVTGRENIPAEGRLSLCANHHNNLDPLFISIVFPRQISWMGKKELFQNKALAFILNHVGVFPVDRDGSDISAIKKALKVLKSGGVLGIFPEGTRVKSFDLNNAKPGIALLTVKSKSTVLPVYIDSTYKLFSKVHIKFGKPIDMTLEEGQSVDYTQISKNILISIYNLANNDPA